MIRGLPRVKAINAAKPNGIRIYYEEECLAKSLVLTIKKIFHVGGYFKRLHKDFLMNQ